MTNKERAEQLAVDSRGRLKSCVDLAAEIERALDEVERKHNSECFFWEIEFKRGKIKGREEMRERAAKVADDLFVGCSDKYFYKSSVRAAIGALPIEGEE